MKNRLRDLVCLFVLIPLLASCSADSQQGAGATVSLGDDPVAAIQDILNIPDRFDRTDKLLAALRALPADRGDVVEAILNDLRKISMPVWEYERVLLISAWAKRDPPAATKWAMAREKNENLQAAMFDEAVYEWALKDPQGLRTDFKVGMYSVRGWDPTMLRAFVRGWHDSGEPELEEFVRDLGQQGDDRQRAVSELIQAKLKTMTPDEMIEWATELEGDTRLRAYVYARLSADIAEIDPERAVAWCEEVCDTTLGEEMPHWISSSWVRVGGVDALDWLMGLENSGPVRVGMRASFRRLLKASPEEAEAWVEQFSDEERAGEMLQGPVIMYANRLSSTGNPETAIQWTGYIENDWERQRSLSTIARRWLIRDEEAAESWLASTEELPDSEKEDLRRGHRRLKEREAKTRAQREKIPDWAVEG